MEATQVEWVSKEEAGVLLGTIAKPLSSRRVLEMAKEGRIKSGRVRDPNSGQMVVRIQAGSIETYLERKRHPEPIPAPEECEVRGLSPLSHTSRLTGRARELANLLNLLREGLPSAVRPAHLWLTLGEAVDYSNLPASKLVQWIGAGKLPAEDVGIRRGGRWRIRRIDLEHLAFKRDDMLVPNTSSE